MTTADKPTMVVTGISGNLGLRLLRLLEDFNVVGVDIRPPRTDLSIRYDNIDLGREPACRQLVQILKQTKARAVVHLAFSMEADFPKEIDTERMWQTNVAGTARVMEAITEINRHGGAVDSFIFQSCASVYGPETAGPVKEDFPLGAHSLTSAVHKQEADDVVRFRAEMMGNCSTYVLRAQTLAGASTHNFLLSMLRGNPVGTSRKAVRMREEHQRLPVLCPGREYLASRIQFLHIDDMARMLAFLLRLPITRENRMTALNVASRGMPITFEQAAHIANANIVNVPGRWLTRLRLQLRRKFGLSKIPPQALPYLIGSCTADVARLKIFLGKDFESVIQHTVVSALEDCFHEEATSGPTAAAHPA